MKQKDRMKSIGGSDAPGVLGLSRWSSPLKVWAEKTGQVIPEPIDNEQVNLGRELEDYVARRFMKLTGKKVRRVNQTLYHPQYPFLSGNIDRRVVGEDAILECKTASVWKSKEWQGEEIPQEYIIQVMHYLAVTGAQYAYIAVLIGNQQYIWKRIDRDEPAIDAMIEREVDFWNTYIVPKVMPMEIRSQDSNVLLNLFPEATPDSVVELDDNVNKIIEVRNSILQDIKNLEDQAERRNNLIKAMLGVNEYGESDLYKVSWKNQVRTSIDTKRLKETKPEIYNEFSKTSNFRMLRITNKKGA
jgi:putative phage-type endonuclease